MARRSTVNGNTESRARSPRTTTSAAGSSTAPRAAGQHATATRSPTPEEVRRRAYEIYLARRGVGGSPESDWLQAERELRGR